MRLNPRRRQDVARMETIDMVGDMKDIMGFYNKFRSNPMQFLNQRFNIPQNVNLSDTNAILQHLMSTGQVSQNQINQVMQMKNQLIH
jgi:hypothetical protein